ncbi:MAG: phosphatase PAP2 family protein [Bacteroidota bacterium]
MFSTAFKYFLLGCLLFWIVGAVVLLTIDKGDWVIYLNQHRTVALDYFFKYWTHLGDGLFVVAFAIVLLFVKYRYSLIFAVTAITQGLVSALMKRVIFSGHHRPRKFLAEVYELQFIEGVDVHKNFSFPSGHTMTAFCIGAFLALVVKDKRLGLLLFVYSILVGFSRNYLSQHFLEDIYAGSFIGVLITVACWIPFKRKQARGWLDGNLYQTIVKR